MYIPCVIPTYTHRSTDGKGETINKAVYFFTNKYSNECRKTNMLLKEPFHVNQAEKKQLSKYNLYASDKETYIVEVIHLYCQISSTRKYFIVRCGA